MADYDPQLVAIIALNKDALQALRSEPPAVSLQLATRALSRIEKLSTWRRQANLMALKCLTLCTLARIYYACHKFMTALKYTKQAKQIQEVLFGKQTISMAIILLNQSVVCNALEKRQQALQLCSQAVLILQKLTPSQLQGKSHEFGFLQAASLFNLACQLEQTQRYHQSQQLFKEGVRIAAECVGKDSLLYLTIQSKLKDRSPARLQQSELKRLIVMIGGKKHKQYPSLQAKASRLLKKVQNMSAKERQIASRYIQSRVSRSRLRSISNLQGQSELQSIRELYLGKSRRKRVATQLQKRETKRDMVLSTVVDKTIMDLKDQSINHNLFLIRQKIDQRKVPAKRTARWKSITVQKLTQRRTQTIQPREQVVQAIKVQVKKQFQPRKQPPQQLPQPPRQLPPPPLLEKRMKTEQPKMTPLSTRKQEPKKDSFCAIF